MNPIADYFDKAIASFGDPADSDYQSGFLEAMKVAKVEVAAIPIPMLLFCPACGAQHIDAPDPRGQWNNPPHRSHLCDKCGCTWRPSDLATTGVARIETRGERDSWSADAGGAFPLDPDLGACELCAKPLARGQFVNQYDDVGTAHANCDDPFARPSEETPAPGDDGTSMPTYVLLGKPALLIEAPKD